MASIRPHKKKSDIPKLEKDVENWEEALQQSKKLSENLSVKGVVRKELGASRWQHGGVGRLHKYGEPTTGSSSARCVSSKSAQISSSRRATSHAPAGTSGKSRPVSSDSLKSKTERISREVSFEPIVSPIHAWKRSSKQHQAKPRPKSAKDSTVIHHVPICTNDDEVDKLSVKPYNKLAFERDFENQSNPQKSSETHPQDDDVYDHEMVLRRFESRLHELSAEIDRHMGRQSHRQDVSHLRRKEGKLHTEMHSPFTNDVNSNDNSDLMVTARQLKTLIETSRKSKSDPVCDPAVATWLRTLQLRDSSKYVDMFAKHEIDFEALPYIGEGQLREMGVTAVGALNKLIRGLESLRTRKVAIARKKSVESSDVSSTDVPDTLSFAKSDDSESDRTQIKVEDIRNVLKSLEKEVKGLSSSKSDKSPQAVKRLEAQLSNVHKMLRDQKRHQRQAHDSVASAIPEKKVKSNVISHSKKNGEAAGRTPKFSLAVDDEDTDIVNSASSADVLKVWETQPPANAAVSDRVRRREELPDSKLNRAQLLRRVREQKDSHRKQIRHLESELSRLKHRDPLRFCEIDESELRINNKEKLGEGAFSVVYKAKYHGTEVAVKKLRLPLGSQDKNYFASEVTLLKELRHPRVVLLIGVCSSKDRPIMVLEYMPLGSLHDLLHNPSRPSLDHAGYFQIARDVSQGMCYLHSRRPPVLHLDLKPANVLLTQQMRAKVADFGFSKLRHAAEQAAGHKKLRCQGTPAWIAPELLKGKDVTTRADVYSFGLVLWEMLSRRRPYEGCSVFQVMEKTKKNERPKIPDGTAADLGALISSCWDTAPAARPTFIDISEQLEALAFPPAWKSLLNDAGVPSDSLEDVQSARDIISFVNDTIDLELDTIVDKLENIRKLSEVPKLSLNLEESVSDPSSVWRTAEWEQGSFVYNSVSERQPQCVSDSSMKIDLTEDVEDESASTSKECEKHDGKKITVPMFSDFSDTDSCIPVHKLTGRAVDESLPLTPVTPLAGVDVSVVLSELCSDDENTQTSDRLNDLADVIRQQTDDSVTPRDLTARTNQSVSSIASISFPALPWPAGDKTAVDNRKPLTSSINSETIESDDTTLVNTAASDENSEQDVLSLQSETSLSRSQVLTVQKHAPQNITLKVEDLDDDDADSTRHTTPDLMRSFEIPPAPPLPPQLPTGPVITTTKVPLHPRGAVGGQPTCIQSTGEPGHQSRKNEVKDSGGVRAVGISIDANQLLAVKGRLRSTEVPSPSQLKDLSSLEPDKLSSIAEILKKAVQDRREAMNEDALSIGDTSVNMTVEGTSWSFDGASPFPSARN